MKNEPINIKVCHYCFHEHTDKCDKKIVDGIQCTCPMHGGMGIHFQKDLNETYQILDLIQTNARRTLEQISYVECEHKSDQVKQAKEWACRVYTLSELFNTLVAPYYSEDDDLEKH